MGTLTKTASDLHTEEQELYKALRAWYMFPGLQRELRNKENEAVQMVLEILERRRSAQKAAASKAKDL
jgi:hypothetical protein